MNPQTIARAAGVLFLITFVTSIPALLLFDPILQDGGYEHLEDIVGKTDFELSWRETAHIYRADDIAVVEHGVSKINYEEPQVHQDGRRLWLRTTKVPLRDDDGQVIGMFGCYEDVTERHETLRALRESEARFRTLFEQAQDGIFVTDARGYVTSVNSAGRELLGYGEEELRRMHVSELVDVNELEERPLRFQTLTLGERLLTQRTLRRKDGGVVPTEINVTVLPDG